MILSRTPHSALSVILVLLSVICTVVGIAGGLSVEPGRIEQDIGPGGTWTGTIVLSTSPDETDGSFAIEVLGLGQSPLDGSYLVLGEPEDTSPYSARPFLSVNASRVNLNPGDHAGILATVRIPDSERDGGRFAAIAVRNVTPATGEPDGDLMALIPVFLTLQGGNITKTGEITALEFTESTGSGGAMIATWFMNTGNHQIEGALNRVTIKDRNGVVFTSVATDPLDQALIPGQETRFTVSVDKSLPGTEYVLTTRIEKKDDVLLAEQDEILPGIGREAEVQDSQPSMEGVLPTMRVPGFYAGAALLAVFLGIAGLIRKATP